MSTVRHHKKDLIGLDKDGRPCEVCGKHMHSHEWADLDEDGFVTNCSFQGESKSVTSYTVTFDAKTVEELISQLVGACSSTCFWDKMPANYPSGAGTFCEDVASNLVKAAMENLTLIAPLYYDDGTMLKVYQAMARAGIPQSSALDAVTNMQNAGVFFREVR